MNLLKNIGAALAVSLVTATSLCADGMVNDGGFAPPPGMVRDGYRDGYRDGGFYGSGPGCCAPSGGCCWYNDVAFSAEALVFQACEDGLAYGTQINVPSSTITTGPTVTTVFERVKTPHFKWDWGYRLGLHYDLPCDCWGLAILYTHYNSHTTSHADNERTDPNIETSFFIPAWGVTRAFNDDDAPFISSTEARWKMRLDLLDIELGRAFCISDCLTLRPHIGVRAVWLNQTYNINNFSESFTGSPSVEFQRLAQHVHLSSDYESAGLRGGLDTCWELGCGMCLYGKAAASILAGSYNMKTRVDVAEGFPTETSGFADRQKDDFCACRAVLDAALGLQYKYTCDCMTIKFHVAWEQHIFLNHNTFEDIVNVDGDPEPSGSPFSFAGTRNPQFHRGDLCIKGVSFGATFDF